MLSELEEYRRRRLIDDLVDVELCEDTQDLIVCPECGCCLYKLDYERGIVCADFGCDTVIDISKIQE